MTTALHLAHVHQPPVKKRQPKRTGGGNGDQFARLAHEIYQDKRADAQSRELLLAVAYAVTMAPLDEETSVWRAAVRALGPSSSNQSRLPGLVRHDRPHYEAPGHRYGTDPLDRVCVGPRIRPYPDPDDFRNTMNICGAPAQDCVVEKLPETGWHKNHWFCTRHRDQMLRVRAQVKDGNAAAPDAIPNRGGLLPCYFESDWVEVYRFFGWREWKPPVYGVRADDWPVPGRDAARPSRPRLRLVLGGDDLETTGRELR